VAPKSYNHLTYKEDSGPPVLILLYHAIIESPLEVNDWSFLDAAFFREQMQYIKNHFEVLSLPTAVTRMRGKSIRSPTVVITFDDGFQNNYEVAFPILQKEGIPATIFLVTGFIDTDDTLWFCRLNRAFATTAVSSLKWNSTEFKISTPAEKMKTSRMIQAQLKSFPHSELLIELRMILRCLEADPDSRLENDSPFRMLNREEIRNMTQTGLIEVGAHTQSHAILSLLSPQQRREEIEQSLKAVEEMTGNACRLFAYPNGRSQDYDDECIQVLRELGVETAVTFIEGVNDCNTSTMELKRFGIGPHFTMETFVKLLTQQTE